MRTSSTSEHRCAFCAPRSTVHSRVLAANRHARAFLTLQPVTAGHSLIVPRRCTTSLSDLTAEEVSDVLALRSAVVAALTSALKTEGFNYAWNEGEVAGQTVPHFHLHVVPRTSGDTGVLGYDPRQFFYRPGARPDGSLEDLGGLAATLRACITTTDMWLEAS